ncbi:MAG: FixH family protein [Gammaproteobacteria bacterium]|nr:FixH family protein [Gammaproteobacteria bacterium]
MSEKQSPWRSPWIIGWMSMLVIFVAANGVMFYLAIEYNPGLVDENFYDRGQDYEQNMLKRMARDPGWKMSIDAPEYVDIGKPTTYGFKVTTKEGQPVTPDSVTFRVYRPSGKKHDFSVPMKQVSPGFYQADISYPLLGVWDILISAQKGEDEYNLSHRVSAGVK